MGKVCCTQRPSHAAHSPTCENVPDEKKIAATPHPHPYSPPTRSRVRVLGGRGRRRGDDGSHTAAAGRRHHRGWVPPPPPSPLSPAESGRDGNRRHRHRPPPPPFDRIWEGGEGSRPGPGGGCRHPHTSLSSDLLTLRVAVAKSADPTPRRRRSADPMRRHRRIALPPLLNYSQTRSAVASLPHHGH